MHHFTVSRMKIDFSGWLWNWLIWFPLKRIFWLSIWVRLIEIAQILFFRLLEFHLQLVLMLLRVMLSRAFTCRYLEGWPHSYLLCSKGRISQHMLPTEMMRTCVLSLMRRISLSQGGNLPIKSTTGILGKYYWSICNSYIMFGLFKFPLLM